MTAETFQKHPKDEYPFRVVYVNEDGLTTYTISSLSVTATDSAGTNVLNTVTNPSETSYSGNTASVWVRAGTTGQTYEIEVTATMASGEKLTKQLFMEVTDETEAP